MQEIVWHICQIMLLRKKEKNKMKLQEIKKFIAKLIKEQEISGETPIKQSADVKIILTYSVLFHFGVGYFFFFCGRLWCFVVFEFTVCFPLGEAITVEIYGKSSIYQYFSAALNHK